MNSLIIPVYRNAENIDDLVAAVSRLQDESNDPLEVLFVVDGSPDRSEGMLRERLPLAPFRSRLICHSRNFGSFAAVRTGMSLVEGERIAVMAADLQEPPGLVLEFFRTLKDEPFDVCVGTRVGRDDPLTGKLASLAFWSLFRRLVMSSMPAGGIDVFACTREVGRVLAGFEESHSSLVAQLIWIGFRRKEIPYRRQTRRAGRSGWSFRRRARYMVDSIFAFTDRPLQLITLLGTIGIASSVSYGTLVITSWWLGYIKEPGYTALATLILFSMFLNLFCLGIVGQYVWRTFENSKARPLAIVREASRFGPLE